MSLDRCDLLFLAVNASQSMAEICHALEPVFDRYMEVHVGLGRGGVFRRARSCPTANPWATLEEVGPPPKGAAQVGRFNDPGGSLLYAALREETALAEIKSTPGQIVQVIGYRALLGQCLRLAVVGEMMNVHKLGYMRFSGSDPEGSVSGLLNGLGYGRAREVIYIDAFLHSLLTAPDAEKNDYVFTRAVAAMIHRDPNVDGIIFPSTKDPSGFNITLRPEAYASKVHAVSCFQCQMSSARQFAFVEYVKLREAIHLREDGSTFKWADPLPEPNFRFFNLTKEEFEFARTRPNDPNAFIDMKRVHGRGF